MNDIRDAVLYEKWKAIKRSRLDGWIFVATEFLAFVVYCLVNQNLPAGTDFASSAAITLVAGVTIALSSYKMQRSAILESEDCPIAILFAATTALATIVLGLHAINPPTGFMTVSLIVSSAGLLAELAGRIGTNLFEWAVDRITLFYAPRPQSHIQTRSGPYRYNTGA